MSSTSLWGKGLVFLVAGAMIVLLGQAAVAAAPTNAPVVGGTLRIVGSGDIDDLDTCCTAYSTTDELLRAVSRQLVSFPTSSGTPDPTTPVPDIATYSATPNGLAYTFDIKQGVMWDAPNGPRQVTSSDEVLALKRLCNPVQPAQTVGYVEDLIAGMQAFCSGFQSLNLPNTQAREISALSSYIGTHQISGLSTPNSSTIVITLDQPSASFLDVMALPMSSPVPSDVLKYLPGSIQEEEHFISDGPYTISSYTPGTGFTLDKDPFWQQSTDPLRHQYFNAIDITEGLNPTTVQQELQSGTADLEWDTTVPPADVKAAASSPQFVSAFVGGITYLDFNMRSTDDGGALLKPAVRQALEYCPNKRQAVVESGGANFNHASDQILPPQIAGYQKIDPYPTASHEGNAAKCKLQLAAVGYPQGLTLTLAFPDNPPFPTIASSLQANFAAAGVTLKLDELHGQGAYIDYLETPADTSQWDLALWRWFPQWADGSAAESFFTPLLDGNFYQMGSPDYGDYNDSAVDAQVATALADPTPAAADAQWAAADKYAMKNDPPWIPLTFMALPQYVGLNVQNAIYNGSLGYVDITNLWKT